MRVGNHDDVYHNTIEVSQSAGVPRHHYVSSACVCPDSLQMMPDRPLKESDTLSTGEGRAGADNAYGLGEADDEMQCRAYHDESGLATSFRRYLTVQVPGEMDSPTLPALIWRALGGSYPFEIWGSGNQERGFTHVDVVEGSIREGEFVGDGTPINFGTATRYPIDEDVEIVLREAGFRPHELYSQRLESRRTFLPLP